jgi:hypothetical protein
MPQFQKGQSGNPAGRPPGSRNRATSMVQNLLEGAAENIAKRATELAQEGNVAAIRMCMNRLSPIGQHNPVAFELPPIHSPQDCGGAEHACCRPCYLPVRVAVEFAFCQSVQRGDEGSL